MEHLPALYSECLNSTDTKFLVYNHVSGNSVWLLCENIRALVHPLFRNIVKLIDLLTLITLI